MLLRYDLSLSLSIPDSSLGCLLVSTLPTLHHPVQPTRNLAVEAVPLMHTCTARAVIVEDEALFVSDLPEGVERTLHMRRDPVEHRHGNTEELDNSNIPPHRKVTAA